MKSDFCSERRIRRKQMPAVSAQSVGRAREEGRTYKITWHFVINFVVEAIRMTEVKVGTFMKISCIE